MWGFLFSQVKLYRSKNQTENVVFFFLLLDDGRATIIMADIYVESFGNIEEANMVRNVIIIKYIKILICPRLNYTSLLQLVIFA